MNSLIHADIFFFVTTIVVIVVGVAFVICLVYAVRIFNDVSAIAKKVREETERVVNDIGSLRTTVKEEGQKLSHIINFASGFMKAKSERRTRTKKSTEEN